MSGSIPNVGQVCNLSPEAPGTNKAHRNVEMQPAPLTRVLSLSPRQVANLSYLGRPEKRRCTPHSKTWRSHEAPSPARQSRSAGECGGSTPLFKSAPTSPKRCEIGWAFRQDVSCRRGPGGTGHRPVAAGDSPGASARAQSKPLGAMIRPPQARRQVAAENGPVGRSTRQQPTGPGRGCASPNRSMLQKRPARRDALYDDSKCSEAPSPSRQRLGVGWLDTAFQVATDVIEELRT